MSNNSVFFTGMCTGPGVISYVGHDGRAPYSEGYVITFYCDDGYKMNGNRVLTCQANGTWDNSFPNCTLFPGRYNHMHKTTSSSPTELLPNINSHVTWSIFTTWLTSDMDVPIL